MKVDEIQEILSRNLAEIGPVTGMNNHQGSKITADLEMMEAVLAFCRDQEVIFLDSKTTAETTTQKVAQNMGLQIKARDVFIDNEQSRQAMNTAINGGLAIAEQKGVAILIGHAWSPELAPLLVELYENLTEEGYQFVPVSDLFAKAIDKTDDDATIYE
jgi:polysaccharide deacetylase 2 family uncharacterized protein YibQ